MWRGDTDPRKFFRRSSARSFDSSLSSRHFSTEAVTPALSGAKSKTTALKISQDTAKRHSHSSRCARSHSSCTGLRGRLNGDRNSNNSGIRRTSSPLTDSLACRPPMDFGHGDAPNGHPARRQFARIRRNESQTSSLPNFNDQSSERTYTSLLARLPGVQQIAPSVHKTEGAILVDLAIGPLRVRLPHSPRKDQWKPAHS